MRLLKVDSPAPIMLSLIVAACGVFGFGVSHTPADEGTAEIVIRGSSAFLPVVEEMVQSYSASAAGVHFDVEFAGSTKAIRDLVAERADIAATSRPMSPEEQAAINEKGLVVREMVARSQLRDLRLAAAPPDAQVDAAVILTSLSTQFLFGGHQRYQR